MITSSAVYVVPLKVWISVKIHSRQKPGAQSGSSRELAAMSTSAVNLKYDFEKMSSNSYLSCKIRENQ